MKFPLPNFLRSRRAVAAVAALLLVLFLWRPGVYRLRNRIANSIGSALGRKVALNNVRLRLLPQPGFDLEGLVIYDDPAFSAEPMIRAEEVSAAIRFRSLLHGRLEIATLSASEPSINLVRNDEGRWNLSSLVERNARIPAAPTGKTASPHRPAFPYLEASHARVNFKIGQTKKSYALMDADVALWQDSENSWSARIKAEPVRTDFHLTDTGVLQIDAAWQRAANLFLTPVQVTVQWQKGQLGQISQLLSGKDRGWRGGVDFTAQLTGTPQALRIQSQTAVEDFHRYDIVQRDSVRLAAECSGQYNAVTGTLAELLCNAPVGGGALGLQGSLALAASEPTCDLTLAVKEVPLASVIRLLRHSKKQIPVDLTASGSLNAEFHAGRSLLNVREEDFQWSGSGAATGVSLSSNAGNRKDAISFGTIPLKLVSADAHPGRPGRLRTQENEHEPAETHLRLGPVQLVMNASAPVNGGGWISAGGYRFFLRGDVELKDLFRLEDILGLPVTRPAAEGSAKLDASVSGPWQGFAPAETTGTAQLRNVHAEMRGLNTPIEIGSATMTLAADSVLLQKISARTGNTHWSGEATAPRHCTMANAFPGAAPACVFQFDLAADQLSTGDLVEWFTPHPVTRPWYRILNSSDPLSASPLLALQARGNLHVGRFGLKKVVATQVATRVEVDRGKITLSALRAQLLQGTYQGSWTIDASKHDESTPEASSPETSNYDAPTPTLRYHGTGTLHDISMAQVGALMNDAWIAGICDGSFDLEGSGDSYRELLSRTDGKLQFAMRNGSLLHVEIPGSAGPLPVYRFGGELQLKKGAWELSAGRLESHEGIYKVSGSASPGSGIDFVLTRGDEQSFTLSGTLAKPHIVAVNRTVAKRADATAKNVKP